MNDKDQYIDDFLDQAVLGKSNEDLIAAMMRSEDRDKWLRELVIHQSAAALLQRSAVFEQVKDVHEKFLADRITAGVEEDNDNYTGLSAKKVFRFLAAMAAVFLLVCLGIIGFWYSNNNSDKLYAEHFHPYRVNVNRGPALESNSEVILQYEKNNLRGAIDAYTKMPVTGEREKMIAASAYLQLQQPQAAETLFKDIIRSNLISGKKLYQDDAEYYLALTYLKQKKYKEAYELFNKIYLDDEHTFKSEVSKWFLVRLKWLQ